MSIVYEKSTPTFNGFISIEEADQLLAWAHACPEGKLDLTHCEHLHTATLQVLMAAVSLTVLSWPLDAPFAAWLKVSLNAIG